MYRNAYQRGMLTVFFSVGSKPLNIWETHTQDGYISRFLDQDIKSMVLEIRGTNVSTTYMVCPKGNKVLGITMPFLVMIVKNLKKYFTFEVTILDETGTRRRFRVSNFQSTTQILPLCTVMPIGLSDGWNQIQFNLAEFTRRAYKKQFVEVQKLKINANIRLRRIYFTERLIPEDQLPPEYKLYFPLATKGVKGKKEAAVQKQGSKTIQVVEDKKPEELPPEVKSSKSEMPLPAPSAQVMKPPSRQESKNQVLDAPEAPASKQPSVKSIPTEVTETTIVSEDQTETPAGDSEAGADVAAEGETAPEIAPEVDLDEGGGNDTPETQQETGGAPEVEVVPLSDEAPKAEEVPEPAE